MANKEHLEILRRGVHEWNQWRKNNSDIDIDLSYASFVSASLGGANLSGANLSGTDLIRANLDNANMDGGNFHHAKLRDAKLRDASFGSANLRDADLGGAFLWNANFHTAHLFNTNLYEANLTYAYFYGANLSRTNLSNADLSETTFWNTTVGDVDLSEVKGLDTIRHQGPSTIGLDTLYRSQGKIPKAFLRGCGVDDTFITFMQSLVSESIHYYSCFISYSSLDEELAQRIYGDLQSNNVRCWYAPEDMKIGGKIRQSVDHAIRVHDKLLLILSENSVSSQWVASEVESALEQERRHDKTILFPIRLDDAFMDTDMAWAADIRRQRHIGDFTNWKDHDSYKKAFDRLLQGLKEAGKDGQ
ncbi:MAG: toll/interleukin-1 receptor domain-containing protein [Chloroflexota bacterium]